MMWTSEHHDYHSRASLTSHSLSHSSTYSYSDCSSCQSADEMPSSSSSSAATVADDWRQIDCAAGDLICGGRQMATQTHASKQRLDTEELCLICGDRASGYHYNALSCEGCKGFFRRSITRSAQYVCKYGGSCEMDMWMRRKCQACRLLRCRNVGMREECLLSERQCVARNARRQETTKMKRRPHRLGVVSVQGRSLMTGSPVSNETASASAVTSAAAAGVDQSPPHCHSPLQLLSDDQRDLISLVVSYQDKYDLPTDEDIRKVSEMNIVSLLLASCEADVVFGHMVEMAILVTRLVVEFAKHLPGFQTLTKDDQITLLKASSSEVTVLRASRRYDPETDTVVFGDGSPFSPSSMALGHCGLSEFVDAMFQFSRSMASLGVDNAEYALLVSLCIFSYRPGVLNAHAVERIQDIYTDTLVEYVKKRRVDSSRFLAQLLMKLVDLRTINCLHTDCLYKVTITKGSLPPLLREYFDIPHPD